MKDPAISRAERRKAKQRRVQIRRIRAQRALRQAREEQQAMRGVLRSGNTKRRQQLLELS